MKRKRLSGPIAVGLLLLLPLVGLSMYALLRSEPEVVLSQDPLPVTRRQQNVEVGGVSRPQTDFVLRGEAADIVEEARRVQRESVPKGSVADNIDQFPVLKESMNANVRSTLEAVRTGQHPERLSPNIAPAPFNKAVYEANPQAYLDIVEPGRVYQSAQPGRGVKSIGPVGKRYHTIRQLESVRLKVKAAPAAPVTFTSLDLGAFQNQLPSITVVADEQGVATANFTGTRGTTDEVNILAASPITSGRVEFTVTVVENRN